jgi:hypothetical protein
MEEKASDKGIAHPGDEMARRALAVGMARCAH